MSMLWLGHNCSTDPAVSSSVCRLCRCFGWVTTAQQTQQFLLPFADYVDALVGSQLLNRPCSFFFRLLTMSKLWLGHNCLTDPAVSSSVCRLCRCFGWVTTAQQTQQFLFPFADYVDALVGSQLLNRPSSFFFRLQAMSMLWLGHNCSTDPAVSFSVCRLCRCFG